MGFFKKFSNLVSSPDKQREDSGYWVTVRCDRCGEIIRARIDLHNDLSINYGDKGKVTYFSRKVLTGEKRCFQRVEIEMTFNKKRSLVNRQISGGQFVDKE